MKARIIKTLCTILLLSGVWAPSLARGSVSVEMSSQKTLDVKEGILDLAVSHNGTRIYVLTPKGEVLVFSGTGQQEQRLAVGENVDAIHMGPTEDTLILSSRKDKQIKVVVLDLVRQINTVGSPFKGAENAPVEIVVFSEFQCPYCASLVLTLDQVLEKHDGRVKIVFKNYPLRNHAFSLPSAAAALAGYRQGKFWEFHDRLFENTKELSNQKIQEIAVQLGLDMARFSKDMQSPETMAVIRQDMSDATQAGVAGTPSVFINGRLLRDRSLKGFESLIAKEPQPDRVSVKQAKNEKE